MEGSVENDRFYGSICLDTTSGYACKTFDYTVYSDGTVDGESYWWKGNLGEYHAFMDGKIVGDEIRGDITFRVVDGGRGATCHWTGLVLQKKE